MAKIHVVLDSTANADENFIHQHKNLHVVPLRVLLSSGDWAENEISGTDLFRLIKDTGQHPKTSQPAPGDFAKVFAPIIAEGGEIIVITISGELSGTVQSARNACALVDGHRISVIDSGTTAIGMVEMAALALKLIDEGLDRETVAQRVQTAVDATETMFVPGTLEFLHKGGRIGGAAALVGTILQIKPVLHLVRGKVSVLDKVRTRQKAVARMLEELKERQRFEYIGVVHIEALEEGEALRRQVSALYPETRISLSTGGAVLGTHLGPGLVGLIFQKKLPY